MGSKQRPRYYDLVLHVVDRPLKDEAYVTTKELLESIKVDLPEGVILKNRRAILKHMGEKKQ